MIEVSFEGFVVGNGQLSLTVRRENDEVAMDIMENTTGYEIVMR
jgi:hypothetical protein